MTIEEAPVSQLEMRLRGRILQMFAALEKVGATPIDSKSFQAYSFFANVLSPVWGFPPIEGSVLKEDGAPKLHALKQELDHLIGLRFVIVDSLRLKKSGELEAKFRLDFERSLPVLDALSSLPDEDGVDEFLIELADAFLEIEEDLQDDAATEDANYSNPAIASGRVVDFGEWKSPTEDNAAWVTSQSFQDHMPKGVTLQKAEKISLYIQLMKQRAHG